MEGEAMRTPTREHSTCAWPRGNLTRMGSETTSGPYFFTRSLIWFGGVRYSVKLSVFGCPLGVWPTETGPFSHWVALLGGLGKNGQSKRLFRIWLCGLLGLDLAKEPMSSGPLDESRVRSGIEVDSASWCSWLGSCVSSGLACLLVGRG